MGKTFESRDDAISSIATAQPDVPDNVQPRQPGGRYRVTHDMARITRAEVLLVNLLPLTERRDAIQAFECQETPILTVTDSDKISGTSYSYTVGAGG